MNNKTYMVICIHAYAIAIHLCAGAYLDSAFGVDSGELLGAHMVGAEVTELIQGYVVARTLETLLSETVSSNGPSIRTPSPARRYAAAASAWDDAASKTPSPAPPARSATHCYFVSPRAPCSATTSR